MDLVGKCFCFKMGKTLDREAPEFDPVPADFKSLSRSCLLAKTMPEKVQLEELMARFGTRFEADSESFKRDFWWIESIVVPGRHKNSFQ